MREKGAPACDPKIYDLGIPILGVCYGMQLLAKDLGGKVVPGAEREYGPRDIEVVGKSSLLDGIKRVWMSHGDRILEPPPHFQVTARSETALAAMEDTGRKIFAIQFNGLIVVSRIKAVTNPIKNPKIIEKKKMYNVTFKPANKYGKAAIIVSILTTPFNQIRINFIP